LKYLDYKKDANPNAHVKVFNVAMKENGETYEEYIVNAFNYTLREMASYWGHKYMLKFHNYSFFELMQVLCKHHHKMQNDKQIYMELKISNKERLSGSRCIMSPYKSWFMGCKTQQQTIF
jgi:hypothetical protein